jgi:putative ABC transport system permease protein
MMLYLKLIGESFIFAIQSISANKIRTLLTLLGITIGIFCIISVFTVFDSIERNIRGSIESLGSNVVFIQKWPWGTGGEYPWWKYFRRPEPKLHELAEIERRSHTTESAAYFVGTSKEVSHVSATVSGASVVGVSFDYDRVFSLDIESGRYFTTIESNAGRNVAIIGDDIRKNLFGNIDPLGRQVIVWGRKLEVIGTLKREGQSTFGNSQDNQVLVPVNFIRNFIDLNSNNVGSTIVVRAKPNVSNAEMIDELTGIMRSIRRLKPLAEDDFAINETSLISNVFDNLFKVVSAVGWIIGGFSLLVGGFGIANIMFVSVKERTGIIGIQKSVGAKNYVILFQFLFEAVFLAVLGGLIGLLIIFAGAMLFSYILDMKLVLTASNIFIGVFTSALIGLIAGIIPAWFASRLDPVEAMRTAI